MFCYILLFLCLILILIYRKSNSDYWPKRNVVQVENIIWKFLFNNSSLPDIYKDIYNEHPNESYIGIFLGATPAIIIKELADIQAVVAGDFQSFYSRGIVVNPNDVLADNILFIDEYCRWKVLRQKLSPAFTNFKMKNVFSIMEKHAQVFVDLIEQKEDLKEKPFDALYAFTTASISAFVFGVDSMINMASPFANITSKALTPNLKTMIKFFIASMSKKLYNVLNLKLFGEHEKFFIGAVKNALENRKLSNEKRNDFINICLEIQKEGTLRDAITGYEIVPTDEIIAAQAFFLFIAGADTSANAMHFALLELSSNVNILKKLHAEIDSVLVDKADMTYDDIEKLQYLDMIISETMRKYPPIGIIQRRCTKNTVLPVGNVNIDKGTVVILPVYALHRDDRYYANPDVFDPERFSPRRIHRVQKYSYLAFGGGNRYCIGARFAHLQVKVGLARLLQRFTLAEQLYEPKRFEPSSFALRDSKARYDLILRQ